MIENLLSVAFLLVLATICFSGGGDGPRGYT